MIFKKENTLKIGDWKIEVGLALSHICCMRALKPCDGFPYLVGDSSNQKSVDNHTQALATDQHSLDSADLL